MKLLNLVVGMIETNCYIAYDEISSHGVVIDPGANANSILQAITTNNISIDYVLLTHGHFDHILAAASICQATGAKLVIHKNDAALLKEAVVRQYSAYIQGEFHEKLADILAEDGTTIKTADMTFRYVHTPGHTPGSCVIVCGNIMFSGDTLFREQCGRCDLAGGDFSQMLLSLKRLYTMEEYQVFCGHGEATTLSYERMHNPYMKQAVSS